MNSAIPTSGTLDDKIPGTPTTSAGPIFIIGAARSGTTLLQFMLRSHPRLSLPTGESHFFVPLITRANEFISSANEFAVKSLLDEMFRINSQFFLEELHGLQFDSEKLAAEMIEAGVRDVPAAIEFLMLRNAQGEGKQRWGDKTPYYSLHLPLLARSFPTAQFLHIVRDGRDCAISMLQRKFDLGIYNTYDAAFIWRRYVDSARQSGKALGPQRYFEFRYEDLLTDPTATMGSICDFLGEPFSQELVNYRKAKNPAKTPLLGKPIRADNSEKWRTAMSAWDLRVFEGVAGATLKENGYTLAAEGRRLDKPTELAYRVHSRLLNWYRKRSRKRH